MVDRDDKLTALRSLLSKIKITGPIIDLSAVFGVALVVKQCSMTVLISSISTYSVVDASGKRKIDQSKYFDGQPDSVRSWMTLFAHSNEDSADHLFNNLTAHNQTQRSTNVLNDKIC